MHLDGENDPNRPHAFGRVPGAQVKQRMARWRQMQEVVQRFPHLLEQRMFVVKLMNLDRPIGVVSLRVGTQKQCCYCPCSCCTKTSAHPDLRHLRQAVNESGILMKPEAQGYCCMMMCASTGRECSHTCEMCTQVHPTLIRRHPTTSPSCCTVLAICGEL